MMKKSLFKCVEIAMAALWIMSVMIHGFRMEGFPVPLMSVVYEIMIVTAPVYAIMIVFRWKTKWPQAVNWFEIALALVAINATLISGRSLLYLYTDTPIIFMKVILPAATIIVAALAAGAGIAWFNNRERQRPAR